MSWRPILSLPVRMGAQSRWEGMDTKSLISYGSCHRLHWPWCNDWFQHCLATIYIIAVELERMGGSCFSPAFHTWSYPLEGIIVAIQLHILREKGRTCTLPAVSRGWLIKSVAWWCPGYQRMLKEWHVLVPLYLVSSKVRPVSVIGSKKVVSSDPVGKVPSGFHRAAEGS